MRRLDTVIVGVDLGAIGVARGARGHRCAGDVLEASATTTTISAQQQCGVGRADLIQSEAMAEADMMPQLSLWLTSDALVRPLRTSSGVEKGIPSGPSTRFGVRRGDLPGRGGQGVLTGAVV